jgi:hypothetical protein
MMAISTKPIPSLRPSLNRFSTSPHLSSRAREKWRSQDVTLLPKLTYTREESVVFLDLRTPAYYASAPCKLECAILLEKSRRVRQSHKVRTDGSYVQRALMLSIARHWGMKTAKTNLAVVFAVASTSTLTYSRLPFTRRPP